MILFLKKDTAKKSVQSPKERERRRHVELSRFKTTLTLNRTGAYQI